MAPTLEDLCRYAVARTLFPPTTLLAALQLISHVWRSENQNANAQRIAEALDGLGIPLLAVAVDTFASETTRGGFGSTGSSHSVGA